MLEATDAHMQLQIARQQFADDNLTPVSELGAVVLQTRAACYRNLVAYPYYDRINEAGCDAVENDLVDGLIRAFMLDPRGRATRAVKASADPRHLDLNDPDPVADGLVQRVSFYAPDIPYEIPLSTPLLPHFMRPYMIGHDARTKRMQGQILFAKRHTSKPISERTVAFQMLNRDHLVFWNTRTGYHPFESLASVTYVERALDAHLDFAFDPEYGYLTTSPELTGSGYVLSALVMIPGIMMNDDYTAMMTLAHEYEVLLTETPIDSEDNPSMRTVLSLTCRPSRTKTPQQMAMQLETFLRILTATELKWRKRLFTTKARVATHELVASTLRNFQNALAVDLYGAIHGWALVLMAIVAGYTNDALSIEEGVKILQRMMPETLDRLPIRVKQPDGAPYPDDLFEEDCHFYDTLQRAAYLRKALAKLRISPLR